MLPILFISSDAQSPSYRHALLQWKRELGWLALLPSNEFSQEDRFALLQLSPHVIFVVNNNLPTLSPRMQQDLRDALSLKKHIIVLQAFRAHPIPSAFKNVAFDLMPSFSCDALTHALRGWSGRETDWT